jgi:hypothetical protein
MSGCCAGTWSCFVLAENLVEGPECPLEFVGVGGVSASGNGLSEEAATPTDRPGEARALVPRDRGLVR